MTFGSSFWKKGSVYPHTLMYFQILFYSDLQKYVIPKAGETRGSRTALFCFVLFFFLLNTSWYIKDLPPPFIFFGIMNCHFSNSNRLSH